MVYPRFLAFYTSFLPIRLLRIGQYTSAPYCPPPVIHVRIFMHFIRINMDLLRNSCIRHPAVSFLCGHLARLPFLFSLLFLLCMFHEHCTAASFCHHLLLLTDFCSVICFCPFLHGCFVRSHKAPPPQRPHTVLPGTACPSPQGILYYI